MALLVVLLQVQLVFLLPLYTSKFPFCDTIGSVAAGRISGSCGTSTDNILVAYKIVKC